MNVPRTRFFFGWQNLKLFRQLTHISAQFFFRWVFMCSDLHWHRYIFKQAKKVANKTFLAFLFVLQDSKVNQDNVEPGKTADDEQTPADGETPGDGNPPGDGNAPDDGETLDDGETPDDAKTLAMVSGSYDCLWKLSELFLLFFLNVCVFVFCFFARYFPFSFSS